jgi:hypothetical protein
VAGDDFQVYYREQDASFVLPATDPSALGGRGPATVGSPEAGLTNAQNWARYGIAMAGAIAPPGATASRPEINGLVGPIQDLSALVPRLVLVTPWQGALIDDGSIVRIRYNLIGLLPAGAQIYFQLNHGTPFTHFNDGGIFVPPGLHVLRAYIGDSSGNLWPGQQTIGQLIRVLS